MNFYNLSNYKPEIPEHIDELVYELDCRYGDGFCCTLYDNEIKLSSDCIGDINNVLFNFGHRDRPISCETIDGDRYYFTSIPIPQP